MPVSMKSVFGPPTLGACAMVIFFSTWSGETIAQQVCAAGSGTGMAVESKGNWYCSQVQAITYSNFPGHGHYNKIVNMDPGSGRCESVPFAYNGSLSPLNEELSLHIRGPTWLKNFAFYTPSSAKDSSGRIQKRRDVNTTQNLPTRRDAPVHHGSGHRWLHKRIREIEHAKTALVAERAMGDMVTATINGQVVSWVNQYLATGSSSGQVPQISPTPSVAGNYPGAAEKVINQASSATVTLPVTTPALESPEAGGSAGTWSRQGYYQAAGGIAEGITFLNHFGGTFGASGTAAGGIAFGASLSFASSDGRSGAATPQTLSNALLLDDTEIVILSSNSCGDGGCGYTRPGGVAYHGFAGSQKVFLLEFTMPLTGNTAFNGDMPAIWLNNAQIPLTSQYGSNPDCSCWTSGCGEFDIFEVLDSGDTRCKSTLHMAPAGGSSDWFKRPTNGSVTIAIVFAGEDERAVIRVLDSVSDFANTLDPGTVQEWITSPSSAFRLTSTLPRTYR